MTKKICKECGHESGFNCDSCHDLGSFAEWDNNTYTRKVCPDCMGTSAPQNILERQL